MPTLYEPDNEVHDFLKMTRQRLEKLTPEQCGEASYILRKFAFHLQRCYGREMAKIKYIDRQIRKTIASDIQQYRAPSAEERRELAIKNNDVARRLSHERDVHEARAERLAFVSQNVGYMAGSLDELQNTKRRQRT